MSLILNKVRDVDPNNSEAVKEVLSTFFQNLTKHTDVDSNRWLRALENIINRFPKFCGTHRNTIETYLTKFLDSNIYYNVIEAAKCAHALQQVRPSQEKAATPKACWRDHLIMLSNAAHNLLGTMFSNTVDLYKNSGNVQKLHLQSSSSSPLCSAIDQIHLVKTQKNDVNKQVLLSTRLRNIFVFIQATLVEVYPVAKPVPPQTILEVIVRALSISSSVKQNESMTKIVSVKIQALRTLDALIACLGPNLIPFSALIFKFVLLTLKWSAENVNEESSQVRRGAFDTLRRWLRALCTHRLPDSARGRNWEDELARHIIDDITPAKHIVQLTMSAQPTKHLSKKAKRKLANSMLQESSIASHSPGEKNKIAVSEETNDDIALSALDCAETLLHVCGVFLKPTTHKLFQERLVRSCYSLEAFSASRGLALLRVLEALRKTAPPTVPPPTQYCLHLYSALVNTRADEVSKFCSQALLDIRLHLHCSPPSLNFAVEAAVSQKPADKPKKISARNRAALESLLGANKVLPETTDIINLSDEPSKKKPRLEEDIEISDKISVSSESASSVEISDDDSDVQEVDADVDDETTGAISVAPSESENTATNTENTAESTEYTADATENISDATESTADTTEEPGKMVKAPVESVKKAQQTEDESQETTTQATSEEARTNDEESRDTAANASEATEPMEESTASQEGDTTDAPTNSIHTAETQVPLISADSSQEHPSPRSMEVTYDFPGRGVDKVTILEKSEDDNLPCTNETDDIPITCGQVVKNSQEDNEKNKENEQPKVNGDKSPGKIANNTIDKAIGIKDVSVEDMLADFVDEVIEEKN